MTEEPVELHGEHYSDAVELEARNALANSFFAFRRSCEVQRADAETPLVQQLDISDA